MTLTMRASRKHHIRVALALAGGGPLGAIYEIGALCALDEALLGIRLNDCDHFVGVSAGGFIAAGLANGMTPRDLCGLFIDSSPLERDAFDPAWLMRPAYAEWFHRSKRLPGLSARAMWSLLAGHKTVMGALETLAPALPTGLFSNDEIDRHVARLFSRHGRTNDFRRLSRRLTLVATHLDSGEAAPFGEPGWDHVPISRALAASAALPGLFPPVEIDGQHYVDGALKKTMHASVALEEGVDALFCLNPLVPFHATPSPSAEQADRDSPHPPIPTLVDGGLPAVLNQTFRSMIHSRLELGMKQYERSYPRTAIVLLEPDHRDAEFYLANTFSYRQRHHLAEHAYQQTRTMLLDRHADLNARLAPLGIGLNVQVLRAPGKTLLPAMPIRRAPTRPTSRLAQALNELDSSIDRLQQRLQSGNVGKG